MKPVNLRHKLNNNDLHNTCQKQQEELNELKIQNETMGRELKRLTNQETYGETLNSVFREADTSVELETQLVRLNFLFFRDEPSNFFLNSLD